MQAQKIIVIHPGSLYLRIGRAGDLNPLTILHAIGRRKTYVQNANMLHSVKKCEYRDSLLPFVVVTNKTKDPDNSNNADIKEFDEQIEQIRRYIKSQISLQTKDSTEKILQEEIKTFNKHSIPVLLGETKNISVNQISKRNEDTKDELIFDEDILKLDFSHALQYNIHFPFKRGELNLHNDIGGSLTSVLADMESIWSYALNKRMSIPKSSLIQYGAVLVIADIYDRSILKEIVSLLLQRLNFRACFLVQDHVAATFGAGLGYACVVDMGDQKISISCVEDSICQRDTRVRLGYGGSDITQVFLTLLQKIEFPFKECNVDRNYSHAFLLNKLKERLCNLNFDYCGLLEKTFEVEQLSKRSLYTIRMSDEVMVAPLAFFYTKLFNITGRQRLVRLQLPCSQHSDPEDCFDADYLRETSRMRNGRGDQLLEGAVPVTGDAVDEEMVVVDGFDIDERNVEKTSSAYKDEQQYYYMTGGQIVPLDLAIIRSIERCSTDDMKRKMYGCILLVGGSSKTPGFRKYLEQKIISHLTANMIHFRNCASELAFEVNVCTKEMDATMISWKGAAIMSCLESAPELWIFRSEWEKYGLRILREKAIFIW